MEEQLQEITKSLEESKNYISQLQIQTKKEKRDRAKYIYIYQSRGQTRRIELMFLDKH